MKSSGLSIWGFAVCLLGIAGPASAADSTSVPADTAAVVAPDTLPYREVEAWVKGDSVTLAGTLTVPKAPGRYPAVVLVTGSGPQNRDEELFGFKPFRLIADHLSRHGIAVLRCDDRGVGGSGSGKSGPTTETFARDALAQVEWLRARPEVDSAHVGILGHSEGGLIAPMAAGLSRDVGFVVLVSGPALPGDSILIEQADAIGRALHYPDSTLAIQRTCQAALLRVVRAGTGWEAIEDTVKMLARAQISAQMMLIPRSQRPEHIEGIVDVQVERSMASARQPWFHYFVTYDPGPALRQLQCPVLAFFGGKDLQVPAEPNRRAMERALSSGPKKDANLRTLPGANHLFQPAMIGTPQEYSALPKEFVPGFLEELTSWIQSHSAASH